MLIPPRANANVLGRANAIASAIVVSFMGMSFSFRRVRTWEFCFIIQLKYSLARLKPPSGSHLAEPQCSSNRYIACHLTSYLLDFARSLERYAILFGSDCPSCFHSSASASQYFISEYSISFLASAACSRHMASNTANCFLEYMHFPVVTSVYPPSHRGQLTML
jgi:hypothetical protein